MAHPSEIVSIVGQYGQFYGKKEVPSKYIPFRGNFPFLPSPEWRKFNEAIFNTKWVKDLPPYYQRIVSTAYMIHKYEEGFLKYLKNRGINSEDFIKMPKSEKGAILFDWMDSNSIDVNSLNIRVKQDYEL